MRHRDTGQSSGTSLGNSLRKYFTVFKEQPDEDSKNRARVFGFVLTGMLFVTVIIWLLLLVSYAAVGNHYVIDRLLGSTAVVGLLIGIAFVAYGLKRYVAAAWLLTAMLTAISFSILWQWGINTPFGILLFGLVVILAGILLKARHALYGAGLAFVSLTAIQLAQETGYHKPNDAWSGATSNFGDVLAYSAGYVMIAIISWLYGRQMERSLAKAMSAERALQAQKTNLEKTVAQRTAALEQTQLEEMEQMYRLTQVGSLSTGLLHDLANYLTVLTLDIEHLRRSGNATSTATLNRARDTITYIDTMVEDVRNQLHGGTKSETFDTVEVINEVVGVLQHKARQAGVALNWTAPTSAGGFTVHGDKTRLSQVMTTLICNAIDAYGTGAKHPAVHISVEKSGGTALISVLDNGRGVPDEMRAQLFKTFRSTKNSGMGIGLFLAKQIVEMHFKGILALDPSRAHTLFTITLPVLHHGKD